MIKAVIFDCFGVLVEDALSVLCQELEPEKRDEVIELMHASHRGLIMPEDSNRQVAALLGMSLQQYVQAVKDGELKNQQLMDYIARLKGNYKTAILSNISAGGIKKRFTESELAQHFDAVIASGDIGYAKPEAEIYEIAADWLDVRLNECVFTDDKQEFCDAARAVGMQAIFYKDFSEFKSELEKLLVI